MAFAQIENGAQNKRIMKHFKTEMCSNTFILITNEWNSLCKLNNDGVFVVTVVLLIRKKNMLLINYLLW